VPVHTESQDGRNMKPVAIVKFAVKLPLLTVVLGFILWVTSGSAEERVRARERPRRRIVSTGFGETCARILCTIRLTTRSVT
jgi:hypothetical protein